MKIETVQHLPIYKGKGFLSFLDIKPPFQSRLYLSLFLLCLFLTPKSSSLHTLPFFFTKSDLSNTFLVFPLSVQINIVLLRVLQKVETYQPIEIKTHQSKALLHVHKLPFGS